jgi:phospholipase C
MTSTVAPLQAGRAPRRPAGAFHHREERMEREDAAQSAAHSEMLVEVRTPDDGGLVIAAGGDGSDALRIAATDAEPFRLLMLLPDLFALRTPDSLEWVSVGKDGRLSLAPGERGPAETFQIVRSAETDTHFGFRSVARDRFLAADADRGAGLSATAPSLEAAGRFTFRPVLPESADADAPGSHHACCCGPAHAHRHDHASPPSAPQAGDDAKLLWNDYTHFRIVEIAVHYLRHMENPTAEARFVSDMWDRGHRKIAEGLRDADYEHDWMPRHPFWAMYYYHFYDPDTGHSFPWPPQWYPHNAVTKGGETFDASVRLYREGSHRRDEAFHRLGLSLHYLTDLCQPMHAANFINNPLFGDWRHKGYEDYAEDFVQNRNFFRQPGGYPAIRRDEIEDTSPSATSWLIGVATQSSKTWKEVLKPVCDTKYTIGPDGTIIYLNRWTAAEADPALMRSLWLAPRNTARYLCMWANRVMA